MTDAPGWPAVADEDLPAFHQTADTFLNVANGLMPADPNERVAAAFLYACTRFTAFVTEAEAGDQGTVSDPQRDALTERFETELRDHMAQYLRGGAAAMPPPGQIPDAAIDTLMSINDMAELPRRAFLKLADSFIHPANGLIQENGVLWTGAAMMHACTRFNAYVMQSRGLPPGPLDAEISGDFARAFRALLDFHLGQSVVTERP